jgi:hypothetical protein
VHLYLDGRRLDVGGQASAATAGHLFVRDVKAANHISTMLTRYSRSLTGRNLAVCDGFDGADTNLLCQPTATAGLR